MQELREIKTIAKKLPVIRSIYETLRNQYVFCRLKLSSAESIFTEIYRKNAWSGKSSVSGEGSDLIQTGIIIRELPLLFSDFNISSFLDIPCGDFYWMRQVKLDKIDYIGADIVRKLIDRNTGRYAGKHVSFRHLNLIRDELPEADLIFCRDCLVHFSFRDIFAALANICRSQAEYLLTTTFTGRQENRDILTGEWRPLNLRLAPFSFPVPLKMINEGCTQAKGIYRDKALGLWKIADIRELLKKHFP
ncbi:MAG: class I SAM-dependent methyltransferase [Victivallaceae bacterium]|nr:class I SAM-dependent methyltransferase [Victivallaceae bacterium]